MIHTDPAKRHEFVLLFDVTNGNPNGDPDAGNLPRVDPETMHGLVTDVAIKRKIRNYVALTKQKDGQAEPGYGIFIQSKTALNTLYFKALRKSGVEAPNVKVPENEILLEWLSQLNVDDVEFDTDEGVLTYTAEAKKEKDILDALKGGGNIDQEIEKLLKPLAKQLADMINIKPKITQKKRDETKLILCHDYYDIRMFGAVLTAGTNAGQVRGPLQMTFAQSIDPIFPMDLTITRIAITKESDKKRKQTEMARKPIVPYGLYRAHGFYSPFLACQAGDKLVNEEDMNTLWESLEHLFDFDHSAARGEMNVRGLYVFTHENPKGNAPAHKLFDMVKNPKLGKPAREFVEYEVTIPKQADMPKGITFTPIVE